MNAQDDRTAGSSDWPLVSVIVPVRNEAEFIERTVGSLAAGDYPRDRLEILVVDGMSTDGTREIVARLAAADGRIRLLDNPRLITPCAMNIGIKQSKGEILIVIGGHSAAAPDFVRQSVRVLGEHPEAWRSGGVMETVGLTCAARAIAAAMSSPVGVGAGNCRVSRSAGWVTQVPFAACRRWVYDKVGLFDEELIRNQDDEIVQRMKAAGCRTYRDPAIRSQYFSRGSFRKLARQYFQYGFWRIRTFQKRGRPASLRQVAPLAFVLGWLGLIAAAALWRPAAYALAGWAGLYLLALAAGAVGAARRHGWPAAALTPLAFAVMHFAYGLGSIKGIWSWLILKGRFVPRPEEHKLSR